MTCVPACVCRCGQTGCGCHITARAPQPKATLPAGPACGQCGNFTVSREVNGRPVSLCPRCDLGHKP